MARKTTKAERDRIQKRSADRKRQRAAKEAGEAVTSEKAARLRRMREPVPVYGFDSIPLGAVILYLHRQRKLRRRFVRLLRARLRQMSPE